MKHFKTLITEYLHHGWRKFWILMISNALEWRISTCLSQNIFTIVEEIFEFWWSEIHPNEAFQNVHHRISSPWLKKNWDFDDLKCSGMKDFNTFITKYLHHGWRDFWILIIWNTPEWRISKSIRIEKIFLAPVSFHGSHWNSTPFLLWVQMSLHSFFN